MRIVPEPAAKSTRRDPILSRGSPLAMRHARMATGTSSTDWSDLHMIALGRIAHHGSADVEDIARWLGVPVVVAEALFADLKAAGLLTAARGH